MQWCSTSGLVSARAITPLSLKEQRKNDPGNPRELLELWRGLAGAVPSAETLSQPLATQQGETPRKEILLTVVLPSQV